MKINFIRLNSAFTILFVALLMGVFGCQSREGEEEENPFNYRRLAELQLDFANTHYQAYFHYNMCTFKNYNSNEGYHGRSDGSEPLEMWNPSGLDCEQWAQICVDARMEGGWLTTKHHGGFCLWDSEYTDYDVASSPVKTDVVAAFVKAFRDAGLKVGLYYSILDYHHGVENGSTSKTEIEFLKNQIRELLTNYGPIDYINFDGWSTWPSTPNFDDVPYPEILETVRAIQPECLIINHQYESNLAHADVPFADAAGRAHPYHPDYKRPTAGSDILQRGWWWSAENPSKLKSVEYILSKLNSYNANNSVYILNMSPNSAGRIDENAIERLKEAAVLWKKPEPITEAGSNWGYQYDVSQNLAFMKKASQSSLHPYVSDKRAYPRAEIAIDGVTEGNWLMEQCSGTLHEKEAWWQVDLQEEYKIEEIIIFNSTDLACICLQDFNVSVLNNEGKEVWSDHQVDAPQPSVVLKTGGVTGQHVKIQLRGTNFLRIAEVIVKGESLE